MNLLKKHSTLAIGYFLLIAIIGVLMRLFTIIDIQANYKYLLHTHSHIALLGWVYTALTTLIYKFYLYDISIAKKYKIIFWCTQGTIIGMLLTFPFTGYALFSILFSTLFLIVSYGFTWLFLKYTSKDQKKTYSYKCIRIALWYMVLSSIGPWALGIIMNTSGNTSVLYRNAIYFYLHFQYNGWFIMSLFGILFYLFEQKNLKFSKRTFNRFFWLFNSGVVTTFFISILWMKPHQLFYWVTCLGSLFQLVAFGVLIKVIFLFWNKLKETISKNVLFLLKTIAFFFSIKLLMQFIGALPYFSHLISSQIDFIIAYIHWIFLGIVSLSLLTFLYYFKLINLSRRIILIYLIGFVLTEGFIFYKGIMILFQFPLGENYFTYLVLASIILLIAIAGVFGVQFKKHKN